MGHGNAPVDESNRRSGLRAFDQRADGGFLRVDAAWRSARSTGLRFFLDRDEINFPAAIRLLGARPSQEQKMQACIDRR